MIDGEDLYKLYLSAKQSTIEICGTLLKYSMLDITMDEEAGVVQKLQREISC